MHGTCQRDGRADAYIEVGSGSSRTSSAASRLRRRRPCVVASSGSWHTPPTTRPGCRPVDRRPAVYRREPSLRRGPAPDVAAMRVLFVTLAASHFFVQVPPAWARRCAPPRGQQGRHPRHPCRDGLQTEEDRLAKGGPPGSHQVDQFSPVSSPARRSGPVRGRIRLARRGIGTPRPPPSSRRPSSRHPHCAVRAPAEDSGAA